MSEPRMETVYLESMMLVAGMPIGWEAKAPRPDDYGTPTVSGGQIHFDWSGVPRGSTGYCGLVQGGGIIADSPADTAYAYNIAIPEAGGNVAFTITIPPVGIYEQVSFGFRVGSLVWQIDTGRSLNQQWCIAPGADPATFPWTGSCSYSLWFPDGVNFPTGPARLDFSGGGSIWMPDYWFNRYDDIALVFESGSASTLPSSPWPGPGFPFPPNDPKTAQCYVTALSIEAWDPTGVTPPWHPPWAVATADGWHFTENKNASGYLTEDLEFIYDWSTTYPQRLS